MKLTHFKCDSCSKIFEIKYRNIRLADYTAFGSRDSCDRLITNRHHIQLCNTCLSKKPEKK